MWVRLPFKSPMNEHLKQKVIDAEYSLEMLSQEVSNLYDSYQDYMRLVAALLEEHGGGELTISEAVMEKAFLSKDLKILFWYDYETMRKHIKVEWKE